MYFKWTSPHLSSCPKSHLLWETIRSSKKNANVPLKQTPHHYFEGTLLLQTGLSSALYDSNWLTVIQTSQSVSFPLYITMIVVLAWSFSAPFCAAEYYGTNFEQTNTEMQIFSLDSSLFLKVGLSLHYKNIEQHTATHTETCTRPTEHVIYSVTTPYN